MTAIAILALLIAVALYLRCRRLAARLRRAANRLHRARSQRDEARCRAGSTLVRSFKRRAALVRVARYCRAMDLTLGAAIDAGIKLGRQVVDRDAAIDALTRRVAELMPCQNRIAFVEGELDAARAAAFRAHLGTCALCRSRLVDDVQLAARLSTLEPPS